VSEPGRISSISTFSHPVSLLIWLALQLLVLLLPVMQVQLSDEFPRPAEKLAAEEMVVAQIAMSALLFAVLIREFASAMVLTAASWPFLLLAGLLSSTASERLVEAGAFISGWIIGLALWRGESVKWNSWASAIASTYAIGGAIAGYLRAEFGSGNPPRVIDGLIFGPIVGAIDILHGAEDRWRGWILLPILLMLGGVVRILAHRLRAHPRQVIHNFGG
jgi:hypothetical protein